MLKQLRIACTLILLSSLSLLPMEKEDEFGQEKEFHERLQYAYHGILQDETQSYYKKIDPITSTPPDDDVNEWKIFTVSAAKRRIHRDDSGTYTHEDISFAINLAADFNPTQSLNILIKHNEEYNDIQFAKCSEEKAILAPILDNYNDILDAMHNNHFSLIHYITLKGVIHLSGKKSCIILIECRNKHQQPITLQGMEIVCRKKEKITDIFFDFTDPVSCFYNITCNHPIIANKESCNFFDSSETRNKWVPDESNFYDQDNQILTTLPKFYSNANDHQTRLNKPLICIHDDIDIDNLLYQIPDEIWKLIFLAQNKYFIIEPTMRTQEKAATQWCAMKNIVNFSLVCKRFNAVAQKLLPSYTKEIKEYIDTRGGKYEAAHTAFIRLGHDNYWFQVMEICKAMQVDLNTTKHIGIGGNTFLTQAIREKKTHKIRLLLQEGADPKIPNRQGDMPIDLAYANDLLDAARLIKDNGGDPEDKYEYRNGNFICKQGQGGYAYAPQPANGFAAANNNPAPIPHQTFSVASWITKSRSYLFLASISAGAVAYWLYTKYRAVDEDSIEEDDCLEADVESDNDCLNEASVCTVSQ